MRVSIITMKMNSKIPSWADIPEVYGKLYVL